MWKFETNFSATFVSLIPKKVGVVSKSEIFLVDNVGDVEGLASILGCGVASLPIKYLGLLLGAHYKASTIRSGIIEKMEHRLAGWKMLYLSNRDRLSLIKIICPFSLFQ